MSVVRVKVTVHHPEVKALTHQATKDEVNFHVHNAKIHSFRITTRLVPLGNYYLIRLPQWTVQWFVNPNPQVRSHNMTSRDENYEKALRCVMRDTGNPSHDFQRFVNDLNMQVRSHNNDEDFKKALRCIMRGSWNPSRDFPYRAYRPRHYSPYGPPRSIHRNDKPKHDHINKAFWLKLPPPSDYFASFKGTFVNPWIHSHVEHVKWVPQVLLPNEIIERIIGFAVDAAVKTYRPEIYKENIVALAEAYPWSHRLVTNELQQHSEIAVDAHNAAVAKRCHQWRKHSYDRG